MTDNVRKLVSSTEADWTRESKAAWSWNPSRSLLSSIRAWQRAQSLPWPMRKLLGGLAVVRHRFWTVVTGADIPVGTRIGGGLLLPHPNGVVIHPDAVIGVNCLIFQQVTIGWAGEGLPTIGGHVDIGAGAKLLGRIRVGDHSLIGANAVVVGDVPPGGTAVGCPARVVRVRPVPPAADSSSP